MSMNILTQERNYFPIDIDTKLNACLRRVVSNWPIKKILSYYHVKRGSLYRWLKKFDGNKESLLEHSHKPLSDHAKKLKTAVINKALNLHRRNSDCSFIEL